MRLQLASNKIHIAPNRISNIQFAIIEFSRCVGTVGFEFEECRNVLSFSEIASRASVERLVNVPQPDFFALGQLRNPAGCARGTYSRGPDV